MLQARLAKGAPDDLCDSRVAIGLVVEVFDVCLRVVPAFLQRAVADDVLVVGLEIAERCDALRIFRQDLGLCVDGNLVGGNFFSRR